MPLKGASIVGGVAEIEFRIRYTYTFKNICCRYKSGLAVGKNAMNDNGVQKSTVKGTQRK